MWALKKEFHQPSSDLRRHFKKVYTFGFYGPYVFWGERGLVLQRLRENGWHSIAGFPNEKICDYYHFLIQFAQ